MTDTTWQDEARGLARTLQTEAQRIDRADQPAVDVAGRAVTCLHLAAAILRCARRADPRIPLHDPDPWASCPCGCGRT